MRYTKPEIVNLASLIKSIRGEGKPLNIWLDQDIPNHFVPTYTATVNAYDADE